MLGHIDEWFYRYIGGLYHHSSTFSHITIRPPHHDASDGTTTATTSASVSFDSPRGMITIKWRREDGSDGVLFVAVGLPPSTTAHLYLPVAHDKIIPKGW